MSEDAPITFAQMQELLKPIQQRIANLENRDTRRDDDDDRPTNFRWRAPDARDVETVVEILTGGVVRPGRRR